MECPQSRQLRISVIPSSVVRMRGNDSRPCIPTTCVRTPHLMGKNEETGGLASWIDPKNGRCRASGIVALPIDGLAHKTTILVPAIHAGGEGGRMFNLLPASGIVKGRCYGEQGQQITLIGANEAIQLFRGDRGLWVRMHQKRPARDVTRSSLAERSCTALRSMKQFCAKAEKNTGNAGNGNVRIGTARFTMKMTDEFPLRRPHDKTMWRTEYG